MRAVLISIRPEWCNKILYDEKTIEVRKTRPKLKPPFKCYIYCTAGNGKNTLIIPISHKRIVEHYAETGSMVSLTCPMGNGKVIGEFVCDTFVIDKTFGHDALFNSAACMSEADAAAYAAGSPVYGWHISNVVIYDRPKELSEFETLDTEKIKTCQYRKRIFQNPDYNNTGGLIYGGVYCEEKEDWCSNCHKKTIRRPSQSWCYVEELK